MIDTELKQKIISYGTKLGFVLTEYDHDKDRSSYELGFNDACRILFPLLDRIELIIKGTMFTPESEARAVLKELQEAVYD